MRTINHWIGGQTVDTEPERTGAVYDPAHAWVRGTWDGQELDPRLPMTGPGGSG